MLLVSIPIQGHITPLCAIGSELKSLGHRVAIASCDSAEEYLHDYGFEFLSLGECGTELKEANTMSFEYVAQEMLRLERLMTPRLLNLIRGKPSANSTLIEIRARTFDVVISDQWSLAGADISDEFGIPLIWNNAKFLSLSTTPLTPISWDESDLLNHPNVSTSIRPLWKVKFESSKESFISMTINLYHQVRMKLIEFRMLQAVNQFRRELNISKSTTYNSMIRKQNTINFINSAVGFDQSPKSLPSNFVFTGPLLPTNPEPLGSRLQEYLDTALRTERPVIYVYLGENPVFDSSQMDMVLNALHIHSTADAVKSNVQTKIHIIWSLPTRNRHLLPETLPPTVRWSSRNPQLSIIAHPAVSAVVCHCSPATVHELYFGKPVLCLPSSLDQRESAIRLERTGAGLVLDPGNFDGYDAIKLRLAIKLLVFNDSYLQEAQRVKAILRASCGVKQVAKLVQIQITQGNSFLVPLQHPFWRIWELDFLVLYSLGCAVLAVIVRLLYAVIASLWGGLKADFDKS